MRQQSVRIVVGRLLGDDNVAVGDVDVQAGEVLECGRAVFVSEIIPDSIVLRRVGESFAKLLDVEDVHVGGVALVAGCRPLGQAVRNVVEEFVAWRVTAAFRHHRRVAGDSIAGPPSALDPLVHCHQSGQTVVGRRVHARVRELVIPPARLDAVDVEVGQQRQRRIVALARADHVALLTHLLTRDAAIMHSRLSPSVSRITAFRTAAIVDVERVGPRADAVRLSNADVATWSNTERRRVPWRHFVALGERERLGVGRVNDDTETFASGHRAASLVQTRKYSQLLVLVQHSTSGQYDRRPAVLNTWCHIEAT